VSIVARGRALGLTWSLPEDKYTHTRSELMAMMTMALGGRVAESLVFDEITTGAANDIEKVTEIARAMVTEYGMSDLLGPQQLGQKNGEVFLGRDFGHQANYSDEVAGRIDSEVRLIIEQCQAEAMAILRAHRETLDTLAAALVEKETLDTADLMTIIGELAPWSGKGNGRAANANPTAGTGTRRRASRTATARSSRES
jgi:cell division protease FtsH